MAFTARGKLKDDILPLDGKVTVRWDDGVLTVTDVPGDTPYAADLLPIAIQDNIYGEAAAREGTSLGGVGMTVQGSYLMSGHGAVAFLSSFVFDDMETEGDLEEPEWDPDLIY